MTTTDVDQDKSYCAGWSLALLLLYFFVHPAASRMRARSILLAGYKISCVIAAKTRERAAVVMEEV